MNERNETLLLHGRESAVARLERGRSGSRRWLVRAWVAHQMEFQFGGTAAGAVPLSVENAKRLRVQIRGSSQDAVGRERGGEEAGEEKLGGGGLPVE